MMKDERENNARKDVWEWNLWEIDPQWGVLVVPWKEAWLQRHFVEGQVAKKA